MHPPVRAAILEALDLTISENLYADKVLQKLLKQNSKFGSRDRRETAEAFYDCIRHFRLLTAQAGADFEKILDFYLGHREKILSDRASFSLPFAVQESVSDDFLQLMVSELGEKAAHREIIAMNEQARVCLRTNELLTSRGNLLSALKKENIDCVAAENDVGIFLVERQNVFTTKAFGQGFFEVQDLGSQKIAPFLQPQGSHRVIDACAGGGGKSLHLAALMNNKGKILSLDIHEWKLKELQLRARRAKASVIEARPITSTKVVKRLEASGDRVLLDVPCSGSGVLRRNPDSKLKWQRSQYENLLKTQSDLLSNYSRMMKPDGKLVYATCSILPSENARQIAHFVNSNKGWRVEEEFTLLPSEGPHDGFYAARLSKTE